MSLFDIIKADIKNRKYQSTDNSYITITKNKYINYNLYSKYKIDY